MSVEIRRRGWGLEGVRQSAVGAFIGILHALALASCYSESPLDSSPQVELDRAILGSWRCVSADGGSADVAHVTLAPAPDKEREYHLTWQEAEKKPEPYRAFVSSVRGSMFLNVRPAEDSSHAGWAFFRYALLRSSVVYVEVAREQPFKDKKASASPEAARATLERALQAMPDPLQEFCVCLRTADEASKKEP